MSRLSLIPAQMRLPAIATEQDRQQEQAFNRKIFSSNLGVQPVYFKDPTYAQ